MGERSWQESLDEVERTLQFLKRTLESVPAADRPSVVELGELKKINRRIRLLAYARSRSQSAEHRSWAENVRNEMSGGKPSQSQHSYSPEELRERARVS